ncbi:MAG: hypothetical protein WA997_17060, partial [Anaerolineales bacterium]
MADLYLKNAQVVTEDKVFRGGVVIDGEQITLVVEGDIEFEAVQVVDLGGKYILPGIVDDHV